MPATNKIPVKNNIFLIIYLLFRIGNILRFRLAGRYDLEKASLSQRGFPPVRSIHPRSDRGHRLDSGSREFQHHVVSLAFLESGVGNRQRDFAGSALLRDDCQRQGRTGFHRATIA